MSNRHLLVMFIALGWGLMGSPLPLEAQQEYRLQNNQWQAQETPDPQSPLGRLQAIRTALAEDRPDDAYDLAGRWIDDYPNHAELAQAHFLRGDALSAQRDYYNALFDYEVVLRRFPASSEFNLALEREFEIARLFSNGVRRKFLWMRILTSYGEAEEVLIRIQERAPGSAIGEKASLELGEHYVRQGDMNNAATAFDLFLLNYPRSQRREFAMLRLIQANLAAFKGPGFDATGLIEAAQRLRMYQEEFPAAADKLGAPGLLTRIEESLAHKDFLAAQWYEIREKPVSAAAGYRRVMQDYPRSSAAQQALLTLQALPIEVTSVESSATEPSESQPQ